MLSRQALVSKVLPQTLGGSVYGDVFWNLMPSMVYAPETELPCTVYVANPTDEDREYMLALRIFLAGVLVTEYPVRVDNITWFPVEANSVVGLPGALVLGYSDVVLIMSLYEKEQNEIVDTVSTALTTIGTSGLPSFPGLPGFPELPETPTTAIDLSSIMSMVIMLASLAMLGMMMKTMTKGTT